MIRAFSLKSHLAEVNELFVASTFHWWSRLTNTEYINYWQWPISELNLVQWTKGMHWTLHGTLSFLSVTCSYFEYGNILIPVAIKHIWPERHRFNPRWTAPARQRDAKRKGIAIQNCACPYRAVSAAYTVLILVFINIINLPILHKNKLKQPKIWTSKKYPPQNETVGTQKYPPQRSHRHVASKSPAALLRGGVAAGGPDTHWCS